MENINFIQNGSSKYVGHQAHFPTLSPKNKKKLLLKSLSYFSKKKKILIFQDETFQPHALKENMKEHNPNWPQIPDHPYRILIIGGSGSGKNHYLI